MTEEKTEEPMGGYVFPDQATAEQYMQGYARHLKSTHSNIKKVGQAFERARSGMEIFGDTMKAIKEERQRRFDALVNAPIITIPSRPELEPRS